MKKRNTARIIALIVAAALISNNVLLCFLQKYGTAPMAFILSNLLILLLGGSLLRLENQESQKMEVLEHYRRLCNAFLQNTADGVAVLNHKNRFTYCNKPFQVLLDLKQVNIHGKKPSQVLPSNICNFITKRISQSTAKNGHPAWQQFHQNDTYLHLSLAPFPEKDKDASYIIIVEDYTDYALMEQELTSRLQEVRYHIKTKASLLANVSHELKTPLNAIFGLNHILEETDLDDRQREIVSKISTSSDILKDVINEVLEFSNLKKGQFRSNATQFRLQDLLDDLYKKFQPIASHKQIDLFCDYQFDPDLCLYLDPSRMKQILSNLMGNSCKYTDEGYVQICVSVAEETDETATLRFVVEDTGMSIENEDLACIFSEFYQSRDYLTKLHQGTGLGLPICKYLAELMGGSLWAEKKKGPGAMFVFTITAPKEYKSVSQSSSPSVPFQGNGERVLVVEDAPLNYEVVSELLSKVNIRCDHALSGPAALNLCERNGDGYYNAILMDIHMPVMDGYETSRKLKKMGITSPIIALTATAMDSATQHQYRSLFEDFIFKPFKYTELYQALAPYMDNAQVSAAEDPYAGKAEAIENLGNNPRIYEKHLAKFKKTYAGVCDTLEAYLSCGKQEEAIRLAHSVKGLSATLGLTYLAQSAKDLETVLADPNSNPASEIAAFRTRLMQVTGETQS